MTRQTRLGLFLLLTFAAAAHATGCAGQQVRSRVVAPALSMFAKPIVEDAVRAPEADPEVIAEFTAAIEQHRAKDALILWPLVYRYAQDVYASEAKDGTLGPGPAESMAEGLVRFDALLRKQAAR